MQPDLFFYPPLGVVTHGDFYRFGPSERHQPFRRQSPLVDVLEDEHKIVILMEIPGIAKEAVKIELAGNTVTISGDDPMSTLSNSEATPTAASSEVTVAASLDGGTTVPPSEHFRVRERTYGHFSRSLAVPVGTEDKDVSAGLQHGLLRVTVRKGPRKSVVGKLVKVLSR